MMKIDPSIKLLHKLVNVGIEATNNQQVLLTASIDGLVTVLNDDETTSHFLEQNARKRVLL